MDSRMNRKIKTGRHTDRYQIGIDLSFVRMDHKNGGIESYVRNLMSGFEEIGVSEEILYFIRDEIYEEYRKCFVRSHFFVYRARGGHKAGMLSFQTFGIPKLVRRFRIPIVFFPSHTSGLGMIRGCRVIVNPHDLQHKYFPEYFSLMQKIYRNLTYGISFFKCSRVIAISQYVEETLYEHYPRILKGKVVQIYNPVRFCEAGEEAGLAGFSYILSVNAQRKNKNLITLLQAYRKIADRISQKLMLTGMKIGDDDILETYVKTHGLEDRVVMAGFVPDAQLAWMYEHAELFVTPSMYEGFGMTPVEAMGYGCSVVSSRDTSLLEVTKGLAQYYEPSDDADALAKAMLAVLEGRVQADRGANRKAVREAYDYRHIAQEYYRFFIKEARAGEDGNEKENGRRER